MVPSLFHLRPDVPGRLGDRTVWEPLPLPSPDNVRGVRYVHYEFDEWDGDCLIKASPIYAVTWLAAKAMRSARLTGVRIEAMETSVSEWFGIGSKEQRSLPRFVRLAPSGRVRADVRRPWVFEWSGEDVCESSIGLIVTLACLETLRPLGLSKCVIRTLSLRDE